MRLRHLKKAPWWRKLRAGLLMPMLGVSLGGGAVSSPLYLDWSGSPMLVRVGDAIQTLFSAPLNTNGLTAADPATSWPVTGVAAPDVAWWGDDPTGASGLTTHAFTLNGTATEVDTPFCPDGSHGDVTSGCLKARRFDGTNDWYDSNAATGPMNQNSADFSVCLLFRSAAAGGSIHIAGQREGGADEGWSVAIDGGNDEFDFIVENDAATANKVTSDLAAFQNNLAWSLACGTSDYDGNGTPYFNGAGDTAAAGPGGTQAPATTTRIGARNDGAADFIGDIAAVFFWNSLLDATDMEELFEYFTGILDSEGAPVACTTVGPNTCMVDGALESFSDDWCLVGCELPVGVSGAGSPASGAIHVEAVTNSAVYSRLTSSQTPVGTPTETATSVDLFRDGRQTVRICDDDGAAVEGESTGNIDLSALSTGDKIQVCVYAKDSAGTVLDLQVDESGADACAGGNTQNYAAKTIDTSWTFYEWTHTLWSGDCTAAAYKISPTDWGTVASTTCAEWVIQVFVDRDTCPLGGSLYIETAAAAVGAGDSLIVHDISAAAGIADVADGTVVSIDFTPVAATSLGGHLFEIADSATATDYYRAYWHTDEKLYLVGQSAAEGGEKAMYTSTSAWSPTAGTTYTLAFTISGAASTLSIDGVDEAGANVTLTNAPDSLDNLATCALDAGTDQVNGFCESVVVQK